MKDKTIRLNKHSRLAKTIVGVMLLVIGCIVYLLFRSKTLYLYIWCESLGLSAPIDALRLAVCNWSIPDFIKFSLPDGLYCAAYLLIMDSIWHEDNSWLKYPVLSMVPVITIGSEILQYFGFVKGTFDTYDLICYSVPPIIYTFITHQSLTNKIIRL